MPFVHLHNHSEYSLLNGSIRVPDMVKKCKEMGMNAVALTDYGNLFGAVDFYLEAKKAGIKPILGAVMFIPSHDQFNLRQHRRGIDALHQIVLLIQNQEGYHNLCQLMSKSYIEGFYYKPRVDTTLLKQFNKGLIALSGGWDGPINHPLFEGQVQKAKDALTKYVQIFGDRFYVELQENGAEGQHETNLELINLAKEAGVKVVATNNCHYLTREDAEAFEALLCIQTGGSLHGVNDQLKFATDGYSFKTPEEMVEAFSYCPQAIEETQKIADQISYDFDLKTYHFPKIQSPEGKTLDEFLAEESKRGLEDRWHEIIRHNPNAQKKEYEDRLSIELGVIKQTGFAGYFLIVADFIGFAKRSDIPVGPGRGSAAGSLVAYCTRITDVDPIPFNLLFERFLNPERISMPDVDIDFCMNKRSQVLEYVGKRFGNVSQIITFGKMKAKAVLRDVGRVLDMQYEEVDKIAKLVPNALNITLEDALVQEPRLKELEKKDPQVARLLAIARRLEGLNRHASTHAAGVVISDRPLTDFLPLYKGGNNDVVTQFDMKYVEKIGLIKFDFLGLKTLTVIDDTLRLIEKATQKKIKILDISLDDKKVYELISAGDTAGIFQLESSGMKDLMIRLNPSGFEDLIALVALYRPGPLGSGMVDDFINRKQGKTPIVYDLPQLKGILEDTYGVIVYQEQVMQIASLLAGYSLGEADILRRAMGKKKAEEMAAQRARFLDGAKKNQIPTDKAEKIFDLMAKFAEYGFNKSHSAAYALVSFQTAYLKAHYPSEYMAALLSSEMQDTDKILELIQDCRAHKIKVLPPNINEGVASFMPVTLPDGEKGIFYGLGALKGVGEQAIESIVEIRNQKGGKFESYFDFLKSIDHHKVNKRVIESLIKSGALDIFKHKRKTLFSGMEAAVDWAIKRQDEGRSGQATLFSSIESSKPVGISFTDEGEWPDNEKLAFEKEAFGFYFSGHPLYSYESEIRALSSSDSFLCQQLPTQTKLTLVGMFSTHRIITTKKGDRMAFAMLEDLRGNIEVIIFSDVFKKAADYLTLEAPVVVKGDLDRTQEGVKLLATEIVPLKDFLSQKTRSVHFRIPATMFSQEKIQKFQNILKEFSGPCKGYLHLIDPSASETVMELPTGVTIAQPQDLSSKVNSLFEIKVVEYAL